jgi:hypothetical protein
VLATKAACGGQTSVQTERNELRLADGIPVRQTAFVAENEEPVPALSRNSQLGSFQMANLQAAAGNRRAAKNGRPTLHKSKIKLA